MKLEVEREKLVSALRDVGNVVGQRSYLAILHCVLLEASEGNLTLSTTSLESGVRVSIEAGVAVPGSVAVAHEPLVDWASEMSGDVIKMELEERVVSVTVPAVTGEEEAVRSPITFTCCCGRYQVTIKEVFQADEFPEWPQVGESIVEVDVHDISPAVAAVVWTVLKDDPILEGVLWEFGAGQVTLMATNRDSASEYKLAVRPLRGYEPAQVVLYPRGLEVLVKVADGEVKIAVGENHVVFAFEGGEVYSGTLNGTYPCLGATIDKAMRGEVDWQVSRGELHRLIKLARIFARQIFGGVPHIRFAWAPGDPSSVLAEAVTESCDFVGQIGALPQEGQDVEFHVSADMMEQALDSMAGDLVCFYFQDAIHAIGLEPVGGRQRVAIMPVTLTAHVARYDEEAGVSL